MVMATNSPLTVSDSSTCVDEVIQRVGKKIILGLPLGLGKPIRFVNALYQRAKDDPALDLHIVTALSLLAPEEGSSLEQRFISPFARRLYGRIPELAYARDVVNDHLPHNVKVSEFFFQAGRFLNHPGQQRNFVCTNYTHAVRDLMAFRINVIGQMVSPAIMNSEACETQFSLSCNSDLSLDLIPLLRKREDSGSPVSIVAETNANLPFFGNHAAVPVGVFDIVMEHPASDYPLFSVPQTPVSPQDHLIGFYASTLLRDGGTLQVGIGSLGTAFMHNTILRHRNNPCWRQLFDHLKVDERFPVVREWGGVKPFDEGLYGCSEMMVDGFIELMEAGVLSRKVYDDPELQEQIKQGEIDPHRSGRDERLNGGVVMHGGFYLGPEEFYRKLRALSPEQRRAICMSSVNYINNLNNHHLGNHRLKVAQRIHGRFINSVMMCTLDGAAVSDGLEDGRVVSGVGGQYNFVAMAHELADARSILTLRSTRQSGAKTVSNIVFGYGHCTIPRHLRDMVVTEYGIADLRGQADEQVYLALIRIADARFQQELLQQAQQAGKVASTFKIPRDWLKNTPDAIQTALSRPGYEELFPAFPFSCDFTEEELILGKALKVLKAATATRRGMLATLLRAVIANDKAAPHGAALERMALNEPKGWQARLDRRLLIYGLRRA
jgi:acyl-CoA hydrolase